MIEYWLFLQLQLLLSSGQKGDIWRTSFLVLFHCQVLLACLDAVSVPVGKHDECLVSVSLVARYGADLFLLDTLWDLHPSLQKQAEIA